MITKTLKSFKYALSGIKTTWVEEKSFKIEIFVTAVVLLFAFYYNFNSLEFIILIFGITLVLSAEIINTVIEDLCNKIEPHTDPVIGKIKDMASGFVLTTSIGVVIVGLILFIHHFS